MERASPYNFDTPYAQIPDHTQKEVVLPEQLTQELIGNELQQSLLAQVVDDLRRYDIPETVLSRYAAAVTSFLQNRPSLTERSAYGMSFSPGARYFRPNLNFPEGIEAALSALPPTFKPVLGADTQLTQASLDGKATLSALKQFLGKRRENAKEANEKWEHESGGYGGHLRPRAERTPIGAYELFLTRLNRLQYAFHEPIHILQSLQSGDRLNRLQEEFDPDHLLFDDIKSSDFVEDHQAPAVSVHIRDLIDQDPSIPFSRSMDDLKTVREIIDSIIASNEATMDVISERHLRTVIRNQPALCLWLHNQFIALHKATEEWYREQWVAEVRGAKNRSDEEVEVGTRLREMLGFVAQTYFTAFDSTNDAITYFSGTLPTTLNRHLSGSIAFSIPIRRLDFLNRMAELRRPLQTANRHRLVPHERRTYPSGATWSFESRRGWLAGKEILLAPPLTPEGLTAGTEVYVAAISRGMSTESLFEEFVNLQRALELDDAFLVQEAREELEHLAGVPISSETAQELFGFASYISVTSLDEIIYPRALAVRKALLERFAERDASRVTTVYENLFFDASQLSDFSEQLGFLGFASIAGIPQPQEGEDPIVLPTWEDIIASTSLSIFAIDMTTLPDTSKERVHEIFLRISESDPHDRQVFRAAMQTLADVKQEQVTQTI